MSWHQLFPKLVEHAQLESRHSVQLKQALKEIPCDGKDWINNYCLIYFCNR